MYESYRKSPPKKGNKIPTPSSQPSGIPVLPSSFDSHNTISKHLEAVGDVNTWRIIPRWWLNHPSEKYYIVKLEIFPK